MSESLPEPTWQYQGSLTPPEESLMVQGHLMTPPPVDTLPDPPERGTLVAWLQDPVTGLRWVMLYG